MTAAVLQKESVTVGEATFNAVVLGEGQPTVVLINGLGTSLEEWTLVAPAVAKRARVVSYDRRDAPSDGPIPRHNGTEIVQDLHDLLSALGIDGPLVLVGHSWGGALARLYAATYPTDVVGLVLVDATHENIRGMIPNATTETIYGISTFAFRVGPLRRVLLRSLGFDQLPATEAVAVERQSWRLQTRTARAEYSGIAETLRELRSTAPALPNVPTRVLVAGGRGLAAKVGAKQLKAIRAVWEKAVEGRDAVILRSVPDSGHYISLEQPNAVIDAIEEILNETLGLQRTAQRG